jgi:hypothetical protein
MLSNLTLWPKSAAEVGCWLIHWNFQKISLKNLRYDWMKLKNEQIGHWNFEKSGKKFI